MQNQWQTVKAVPTSKGRILVQSREHRHKGRVYSYATASAEMERPGYDRIDIAIVDGVVKCTNADALRGALDDAINSAILDFAGHVKDSGLPPAFRPQRPEKRDEKKGTKIPRTFTPEQREAKKRRAEENRAAKRDHDTNTRLRMKGTSSGGGKKGH